MRDLTEEEIRILIDLRFPNDSLEMKNYMSNIYKTFIKDIYLTDEEKEQLGI